MNKILSWLRILFHAPMIQDLLPEARPIRCPDEWIGWLMDLEYLLMHKPVDIPKVFVVDNDKLLRIPNSRYKAPSNQANSNGDIVLGGLTLNYYGQICVPISLLRCDYVVRHELTHYITNETRHCKSIFKKEFNNVNPSDIYIDC